jgi:uncharacterized protein YggE
MHRLTLAAAALAATLAAASPAMSEETRMSRLISISGHGEVRSVPDVAIVTSGVLSQGATAAEALAANTSAMTSIFAALKEAGLAEKDMQTSNFMVQPRYNFQDGRAPELVGYDVSNNVTVTLRKIGDLGGLLDRLVKAGSNQINGIAFDVSQPEAALDQARKLATVDATRKAKLFAEAMGVSLGKVMSISESGGYQPPMPMARGKVMMADAAAPVPLAAGEQTISVDVNITWEIQ